MSSVGVADGGRRGCARTATGPHRARTSGTCAPRCRSAARHALSCATWCDASCRGRPSAAAMPESPAVDADPGGRAPASGREEGHLRRGGPPASLPDSDAQRVASSVRVRDHISRNAAVLSGPGLRSNRGGQDQLSDVGTSHAGSPPRIVGPPDRALGVAPCTCGQRAACRRCRGTPTQCGRSRSMRSAIAVTMWVRC